MDFVYFFTFFAVILMMVCCVLGLTLFVMGDGLLGLAVAAVILTLMFV